MKCLGVTTKLQNTSGWAPGYGEAVLARLGDRLKIEYGRGFSRANLQDMRRFHDVFGIRQPVAGKSLSLAFPQPAVAESGERLLVDFAKHYHLGWTHYRILLGIGEVGQRRFCFEQACHQR